MLMLEKFTEYSPGADATPTTTSKIKALQEICRLTSLPQLPRNSSILDTPVFLGHGTQDEIINIRNGELARDVLRKLGLQVEWRSYKDGHWYTEPEEIGMQGLAHW